MDDEEELDPTVRTGRFLAVFTLVFIDLYFSQRRNTSRTASVRSKSRASTPTRTSFKRRRRSRRSAPSTATCSRRRSSRKPSRSPVSGFVLRACGLFFFKTGSCANPYANGCTLRMLTLSRVTRENACS